MTLVIPHALPPVTIASALAQALESRYPNTVQAFNARHAVQSKWSIGETGCTATEGLHLQLSGYQPTAGVLIGSGLGPLHAMVTSNTQRVWIAEFCGTAIEQDRASLIPLAALALSEDELAALEMVVQPLWADDGDGIRIETLGGGRWRVFLDLPESAGSISPMALMQLDLGDWWPTGPAWRAWRKRLNEIQMAWHEHPVNLAREQCGQAPVNSVWLYGGGHGFEPLLPTAVHWVDDLSLPTLQGDWSDWLERWAKIETVLLNAKPDHEIVLTGDHRSVRLSTQTRRWWQGLFTKQPTNPWRQWWINQN
jgi:hypothetical protein